MDGSEDFMQKTHFILDSFYSISCENIENEINMKFVSCINSKVTTAIVRGRS